MKRKPNHPPPNPHYRRSPPRVVGKKWEFDGSVLVDLDAHYRAAKLDEYGRGK